MSHTFSPEMERRTEALALCATFFTAVLVVVVFFPAEGRVLVPVRAALDAVFGQTIFVLPLGLTLLSVLAYARRLHPDLRLPGKRLAGLGLITVALLPADRLLGQSTGLVGEWLTGRLINLLGGPLTVAFTLVLVLFGSALAFNFRPRKFRPARLKLSRLLIAAR